MVPAAAPEAAPGLTPEQRVLLGCLRVPLAQAEADGLRLLCEGGLDWDALVDLAIRHRVSPLVFWNLQALGWPRVPPGARARLSREFHFHASHTFALARELLHVGSLLEEAGVPMVSLKGPTLAVSAYGSVGLRQFGDLDILVPRAQVLDARRALLKDGYRSRVEMAPAQEAAHLRDDSVFDLVRDSGLDGRPTAVELHWALTARAFARPIAFEHVHLRLAQKPLVGGAAQQLDAEDLLIILCVHGTKHLWERLQWLTDISQVVRRAECASPDGSDASAHALDWNRVRGLAERFRVQRMVGLALILAHDVLEAPVPVQVLAWARSLPLVEALAAQVRARLFAEEDGGVGGEASLSAVWFLMRAMDSWRDRARFAVHVATTPPADERAAIVLPGVLERLRPVVRASRLIAGHASHVRAGRRAKSRGGGAEATG